MNNNNNMVTLNDDLIIQPYDENDNIISPLSNMLYQDTLIEDNFSIEEDEELSESESENDEDSYISLSEFRNDNSIDISQFKKIEKEEEESEMDLSTESMNQNNIKEEFDGLRRIMFRSEMMLNEIFRKMDTMCNRIENIENRLHIIENNSKFNYTEFDGEIIKIKEIKNEIYDLSEEDVIRILKFRDYRSYILIFKLYYQTKKGNKTFYPIRMKTKRTFEYYSNNTWIQDVNGHYLIKTLSSNIQNTFLKYNILNSPLLTNEEWYQNQQFIMKLSEERTKKECFKNIIDELQQTAALT